MAIINMQRIVQMRGTKVNCEAWSAGLEEGAIAYATDTSELGIYTNGAWVWIGAAGGGVARNGNTTDHHLAVWNGNNADSIEDGGAVPAGTGVDGWIACTGTWTYSSADAPTYVISVDNDQTGIIGVGMRIKLTHAAATKYFIVTAVGAFGGGVTLITVYGGTDYTLAATAITNPYYSPVKAPFGFPLDPSKWKVRITDTSDRAQASPTDGTWYNLGTLTISIPIGIWDVSYQVILDYQKLATTYIMTQVTLSTGNNSETDKDFSALSFLTSALAAHTPDLRLMSFVNRRKLLVLVAKTPYYLNGKGTNTLLTIDFRGDLGTTVIEAVCAYL
jgi:hypothetical protein